MHRVLLAVVLVQYTIASAAARLGVITTTILPSHAAIQSGGGRLHLKRNSAQEELITCGYLDGNVNSARTAQPGFDCRIDTEHALWAFCPSTVIAATDCGMAAACKDSGTCTSVCKFNDDTSLTTFTCSSSGTIVNYCSTALLTFGVDLTYGYLACGASPETQHYEISATFTPSSSATSTTSTKKAATTAIATAASSTATATTAIASTSTAKAATAATAATETAGTAGTAGFGTAANSKSTSTTSHSASNSQKLPASGSTSTSSLPGTASVNSTSSASTSGTADQSHQTQTAANNIGAIVGGSLGGLALVCVSAVAVVFIIRRNRPNKDTMPPSDTSAMLHITPSPPYAPYHPYPPAAHAIYEADSSVSSIPASSVYEVESCKVHTNYAVELPSDYHY